MTLIKWDDTMKVGVPSVDHEHKALIGEINTLGEMVKSDKTGDIIKALLGEIHTQIEAHFALEEKIMLERAYGGFHAHKEDHDRLLDDIRDIMVEAETSDQTDVRTRLGERLTIWFSEHFRTLDRSFHSFMSN